MVTRTLLLDLDGTLVDTVPDLAAALNRLMQARGLPPFTHPQVAAMVGDGVAVLTARAFAARGRTPDAAAISELMDDYSAHVAVDSRLYEGVLPTLTALAAQGWRLAVCTNKPAEAAQELLRALGVLPLLSAVGGGDSFAMRKPDPGHLLATLALAAGDAKASVMVGDHHNDVLAARGAGIRSIFATWGYSPLSTGQEFDARADNLAQAATYASQWLNGSHSDPPD